MINPSSRAIACKASVTQKLNELMEQKIAADEFVYNLTSGQLSTRPLEDFIQSIKKQSHFLKSYQYSPVAGLPELRDKFLRRHFEKRQIDQSYEELEYDCVIGHGSKQALFNLFGAFINAGDEVILFSPYWTSYPEMIQLWGGTPMIIEAQGFDSFTPQLSEIEKLMGPKTKFIILNSPNNPTGIHYSKDWMCEFAEFMQQYPEVMIISDELYSDLWYFDPAPRYYYEFDSSLLDRTFIIDGISKSFASTGLRIGHCLGPKRLLNSAKKIQSQSTSGANSLIQRALLDFDFDKLEDFHKNLRIRLRESSHVLRESFRKFGLAHCWYQTQSAFYFYLDLSRTPVFEKYQKQNQGDGDLSEQICMDLLSTEQVAIVPGASFGQKHSARLCLALDAVVLEEALERLCRFLNATNS